MERTLILLKPDCVQRRLAGRVIARLEEKGLNIIAMKMMRVTPELAKRHYAEHVAKVWYPGLEAFITSGPIVALVAEGPEAVRVVRELVGRDQRPQCGARHDPRRPRHEPAVESGPCFGQPRGRPAGNVDLLSPGRNLRIDACLAALAACRRRTLTT